MTLTNHIHIAALALLLTLTSAHAESTQSVAVPLPPDCATRNDAIGVSRIVEIDTTSGPKFGHSQYKDVDFLQDGEVVLTFDDGPMRRYTRPILDILDRQCTRATFFSVGRMALSDPETLKETARRGHTIASHTWSHKKISSLNPGQAKTEIELGLSAVALALGKPPAPFFRFPYLRDKKSALDHLAGRNISTFSIEVDSQDFRTRNPGAVLRTVMSQLKSAKKGIILFHDIQPSTAGALLSLITEMRENGYKVVHLVAKDGATTLPEYDAMAAREAARRSVVLAEQPLSDRAVTWPNTGGPAKAADGKTLPKSAPQSPTPGTFTPASVGANSLPWAAPDSVGDPAASTNTTSSGPETPAAATTPPKRRPLWQADEDPWRIKLPGE